MNLDLLNFCQQGTSAPEARSNDDSDNSGTKPISPRPGLVSSIEPMTPPSFVGLDTMASNQACGPDFINQLNSANTQPESLYQDDFLIPRNIAWNFDPIDTTIDTDSNEHSENYFLTNETLDLFLDMSLPLPDMASLGGQEQRDA